MRTTAPDLELDSYLRLNRASLVEWLAAIRELSGCDDMDCTLFEGSGHQVGALSTLITERGRLICLYAAEGMEIKGCQASAPVFLLPRAGTPEIATRDEHWQCLNQLFLAWPEDRFRLRLPPEARVLILRLEPGTSAPLVPDCSDDHLSSYEELITCYLHRSPFFRDDAHAIGVTNELFLNLTRSAKQSTHTCQCPKLDRRLLRAIEKIRHEPGWDFNLQELASHSGVSERNLYYLMKRETGMTPYRLYQRNRLLRVRQRLVDCQCEVPHISWYAADAGFSHLGRFAALYREHFGELPSETVQWRQSLQKSGVGKQIADEPDLLMS
ncbi:Helix-turn-helix domain-containing protein [Marinobacter sp. es.048]|uniref:AraC family transcriptional regulator n=1 Tax=Marinobacter sp. es.048 TaxID=1761795 RepID=UPI000B5951BE|nr:helix-turn-helix domain-containing protein [Marinobacter sp. es.048]SNC63798.1 Helix-turn-helix domain-containing protein [Marinobacter sp. es.048]